MSDYYPMNDIKSTATRAWIHGQAKRLAGKIGDVMAASSAGQWDGERFSAAVMEIRVHGTTLGRSGRAFRAADMLADIAGEDFYLTGGDRTRYIIGNHCYTGGREIEALLVATDALLRAYTKAGQKIVRAA